MYIINERAVYLATNFKDKSYFEKIAKTSLYLIIQHCIFSMLTLHLLPTLNTLISEHNYRHTLQNWRPAHIQPHLNASTNQGQ